MIIGVLAVAGICYHLLHDWTIQNPHLTIGHAKKITLQDIGFALALAAAVELAYTLYTHGPDEALDPLMLGLSAALLLQLGEANSLKWAEGLAMLLYACALAVLFAERRRLADQEEEGEEDWTLRHGFEPRRKNAEKEPPSEAWTDRNGQT